MSSVTQIDQNFMKTCFLFLFNGFEGLSTVPISWRDKLLKLIHYVTEEIYHSDCLAKTSFLRCISMFLETYLMF